MKTLPVPVVMYHSVGVVNKEWLWNKLTCPWELFRDHLKVLKKMNFHTISLQQLYDHMKNGSQLPDNPIVLTFDDGYLDNWVFVYPLLKKYGFSGTIYVNPEFVDPIENARKNLEDVWNNKESIENLETEGFLSWNEMEIIEKESVMDIQSHSMSHTWYFSNEKIIDFHSPDNNKYPWLFWNSRPERKSYYLNENQEQFIPYGTPIYENARSLGMKRYFEDEKLNKYLVDFVKRQDNNFFNNDNWRNELFQQVEAYKLKNELNGRFETDEEQIERYTYELTESKRILEDKLNKEIKLLCWAGGALNDLALRIAEESGYVSSTLPSSLLYNDGTKKNISGEDPSKINRIGCVSAFYRHNKFISHTDAGFFMAHIKYFQGYKIYLWIMRLYKIKYLVSYTIKSLFRGRNN